MKPTQPKTSLLASIREIFAHLSPERRRQVVPLIGLMLLGALAELVTIGAILPFLAILSGSGETLLGGALVPLLSLLPEGPARIVWLTGLFGLAAIAAAALRLWLLWVQQNFVFGVSYDLGVELFRRTIYQPYAYHTSHNSSEILASVNKAQIVTNEVLLPLMAGVSSAVIALFIVLGLVVIDPLVALAAGFGFCAIYMVVLRLTRARMRANSKIIATAQGERLQFMREGLGGIRDVLLDRSQPHFIGKVEAVERRFARTRSVNNFLAQAPRYLVEAFGMVLIAMIAVSLAQRPGGLAGAIPVLGALALGAQRLLPLLQQVYFGFARTIGNQQVLQDLLVLLRLPLPSHLLAAPPTPLPFERSIELRNVTFRYAPDLPPVLENVSLEIKKGASIGIVGKTGSGKSTLIDLILGIMEPTSGEILIDGVPLTATNRPAWQVNIAHVPQNIYLADATIAENIAFGVPLKEINLMGVRDAASQAELADVIEALPQNYDTRVGERGVRLSGGQRQRLAIARALYKRAKVMVLDEATSALDSETETTVVAAVENLPLQITIIMVSHRENAIANFDTIIDSSGNILSRRQV